MRAFISSSPEIRSAGSPIWHSLSPGEARNGNSGDDHRIQLSIEYKLIRWYCCIVRGHFALPLYIDLSATCLYAMTGALLAIRRHYDVVGLFVLALVSGVGGGLIRDGIFIQRGPPLAMSDGRYLFVVILGCIGAALFRNHMDRFQTVFLFADALGVGCYAVVGVEHALNAQLPILASIMIGVVTACGGGLLRDVLVRDEPLLFKPGQLYVLAALSGASLFTLLLLYFKISATGAAFLAIACSFIFRTLAILFNWKTVSVSPSRPKHQSG